MKKALILQTHSGLVSMEPAECQTDS